MPAILLPILGPVLLFFRAWMPGAGLANLLKIGLYLSMIGGGIWGGVVASNWWHSDKLTVQEAKTQCDNSIALAEIEAIRKALVQREASIAQRQVDVSVAELRVSEFEKQLKDARDAINDKAPIADQSVAISHDDGWLRKWQGR